MVTKKEVSAVIIVMHNRKAIIEHSARFIAEMAKGPVRPVVGSIDIL